MKREELVEYLEGLLQPAKFRDYCPNGLQVEGRQEVHRLVAGVTATQALLDAALVQAQPLQHLRAVEFGGMFGYGGAGAYEHRP